MHSLCLEELKIDDNGKNIVDLFSLDKEPLNIDHSLALVGQSGSGKSLTLKAVLDMLPKNLSKKLRYKSDFDLSLENIAFIPQNPFTSLSPMTKIKEQFFLEDQNFDKKNIDEFLDIVDLERDLKNRFPVQLSGGQLQRVVIAIALSKNPKLLLLDEPTTALDYNTKTKIIELLKQLQGKLGFLIIFVSHDIDSIENICKNLAVLENGTLVEHGMLEDILADPKHPYTKKLIQSSFSHRDFRK